MPDTGMDVDNNANHEIGGDLKPQFQSQSKSCPLRSPLDAFTSDQKVILFDKLSAAVQALDKERTDEAEREKWRDWKTATQLHRKAETRMRRARFVRVPRPMDFEGGGSDGEARNDGAELERDGTGDSEDRGFLIEAEG